ncbi:MAG: histidine phosphatase family protein [Candidatus Dojkabacteria bacterium]
MTKIILARHGKYLNPQSLIPFRSNDVSLSEEGIDQIEKNAEKLLSFDISQIYSSPIRRCAETADIYSRILKVGIDYEEDLLEIDSPYENINESEYKKLVAENSIYVDKFHLSHGGESIETVEERIQRVLTKILRENKGKTILLVSHGDPLMLLLLKVQKIDFDINKKLESQVNYIPKGGLVELEFNNEEFIKFLNLNF